MKLTKAQWSKLIGAAMVFLISLLAVFGYDVALDHVEDAAPPSAIVMRV